MAGIAQQALVGTHQRLHTGRRPVEAGGHCGHLVAAVLGHPLVQRAGPKRLHALLQGLQAARQAAHHRPGPRGHGQEQQHHQRQHDRAFGQGAQARQTRETGQTEDAGRLPPRAGRRAFPAQTSPLTHGPAGATHAAEAGHPQGAAVIQPYGQSPARDGHPFRLAPRPGLGHTDALTRRVVQGQRQAQALRPLGQGRHLLLGGCMGRGQRAFQQVGPGLGAAVGHGLETLTFLRHVALHQPARSQREQAQRRQHGEPDAQVQGLHGQDGAV